MAPLAPGWHRVTFNSKGFIHIGRTCPPRAAELLTLSQMWQTIIVIVIYGYIYIYMYSRHVYYVFIFKAITCNNTRFELVAGIAMSDSVSSLMKHALFVGTWPASGAVVLEIPAQATRKARLVEAVSTCTGWAIYGNRNLLANSASFPRGHGWSLHALTLMLRAMKA